jgi:hypothetical protein
MTSLRWFLGNSSGLLVEGKANAPRNVVTCPQRKAASDRALSTRLPELALLFAAALFLVKGAPCSPEHGIQGPGRCSRLSTLLVTQPAYSPTKGEEGPGSQPGPTGLPPTPLLFVWVNSFFRVEWQFVILFWKNSQVLSFQPLSMRMGARVTGKNIIATYWASWPLLLAFSQRDIA